MEIHQAKEWPSKENLNGKSDQMGARKPVMWCCNHKEPTPTDVQHIWLNSSKFEGSGFQASVAQFRWDWMGMAWRLATPKSYTKRMLDYDYDMRMNAKHRLVAVISKLLFLALGLEDGRRWWFGVCSCERICGIRNMQTSGLPRCVSTRQSMITVSAMSSKSKLLQCGAP